MTKIKQFQTSVICAFTALLLLFYYGSDAQQSSLQNNVSTPLVSGSFANLSVVSSTSGLFVQTDDFSNKGRIIDNVLTNSSNWGYIIGGSAWVEVKDNNATGSQVYPAGSIAGFVMDNTALDILSSVTIETYLGNTLREQKSSTNLLATGLLTGNAELGFKTTMTYDRIRINFSAMGVIGSKSVYYAFVKKFVAGPVLACNVNTLISSPLYPVEINENRTGVSGLALAAVSNVERVIDGNPNTSATLNIAAGVLGGQASVSVEDVVTNHPIGTFVGFDIASSSLLNLGVLANVEIQTYLDNVLKETKSGGSLIASGGLLSGTGRNVVGFVTTTQVDEVRIVLKSGLAQVNLGSTSVYGAVFKSFCEGLPFACNIKSNLSSPNYPVTVDKTNSGIIGLGLGESVANIDRIINGVVSDYATINKPLATLGTQVTVAVKKELLPFEAQTFAGFDLETVGLIDLSVLDALTVSLYKNGIQVQTTSGSDLVSLGIPLLTGSGRRTVGMIANTQYDEIRLTVNFGLASVGLLSSTRVYNAVVQNFCDGPALACNTITAMTTPIYPVYVDGKHTGIQGGASLGSINNWENAIDGNTTTFARINLNAGILAQASFAVGDAKTTYTANTYAGFDVATATLLDINALNSITIQLLNNGTIVQTETAPSLIIGANSSLLTGVSRQYIGAVANVAFDEVKIIINQPIGVSLGNIDIYGAVFESLCVTALNCSESTLLQNGTHPVVINNQRTGTLGVINAGSSVKDAWNVLDSDNTKYAEISTVANILTNASISVENPVQTYPAGTFAGFVIRNANGLLNAGILETITISTYNNGVLQESKSGTNLVDLTLLFTLLGPGNQARNIGFVTSTSFDEIHIAMGEVASAVNTVRVYSAFIDTRTSVGANLYCLNTSPDFAVTYINQEVAGNVSTNDKTPSGTTYGTPVANPGNPITTIIPSINPDGTYTFTANQPGKYEFDVPVCLAGQTAGCSTEKLTITVLDPNASNNKPVANDDVALTKGDDVAPIPVTINVKHNDGAGNLGGTLGTPSITGFPVNGTVAVDASDNVIYTPNPGFYGVDYFNYEVCETPSGLCEVAIVKVTVVAPDVVNTTIAVDDYVSTSQNTALTVSAANGVLANDKDPEGHLQAVVPKTETITGKGTLVLLSDGSYTFTPEVGYVGPVQFTYQVNDNGTTVATAYATLHILVKSIPDLTPTIDINSLGFTNANNVYDFVVNLYNIGGSDAIPAHSPITFVIAKVPSFTITYPTVSGISNVYGSTPNSNSDWIFTENASFIVVTAKPNVNIEANSGMSTIGFNIKRNSGVASNTAQNITAIIAPSSGGEDNADNNDAIINITAY